MSINVPNYEDFERLEHKVDIILRSLNQDPEHLNAHNSLKEKEYLTRKEVATYLGKSLKTISNYKADGLVFSRVGMISKIDFFHWLEIQR